ncbi:hypothetical protein P7C70_g5472, partial [Phenoliferia sp. Uapishka_3]
MTEPVKAETTFRKLVRSLSRSSPRPQKVEIPGNGMERSISRPRDGQRSAGAAFSTSPPPGKPYWPCNLLEATWSGKWGRGSCRGALAFQPGASPRRTKHDTKERLTDSLDPNCQRRMVEHDTLIPSALGMFSAPHLPSSTLTSRYLALPAIPHLLSTLSPMLPPSASMPSFPNLTDAAASPSADALGGSSQGAPGVSFAPLSPQQSNHIRPTSEIESWNPTPRRTQSQRARTGQTSSTGGLNGSRRERAVTIGDATVETLSLGNGTGLGRAFSEPGQDGKEILKNGNGESGRRGVQLEDKPLSRNARSTSIKRAASAVKRAVASVGFVPTEKASGEKRILILVADGSEEIEVMTPFDVFVRASLNPVLVSVSPQFSPSQSLPYVTLSRGAKILADTQFETLKQEYKDDFDAVIIPGGAKGAERLSRDTAVQQLIWSFYESGKTVGMICAGSLAARTAGIAEGMPITSHPSVRTELEKFYDYSEERVVISDNLITSRGPGTALEFSLAIVEIMAGKKKRDEVAGPMIL